jgi:hypothetical protein
MLLVAAFVAAFESATATSALAAPGDLIADVMTPEGATVWPAGISPSVAFDGRYLYYTEYAGHILHRIDVPPAGGTHDAANKIDIAILGIPSGVIALSYDQGRDAFWVTAGDGLSVYLLSKNGTAVLIFSIDPVDGRPGFSCVPGNVCTESKLAYDRSDDTLWIGPDAWPRIYHYQTYPDGLGLGKAVLAATPYIDVSQPPNDMTAECGYSIDSAVAAGGAYLMVGAGGCAYYFEYTRTGGKVAAFKMASPTAPGSFACDNVSYPVSVIWVKNAFWGEIRAYEQPGANTCVYGG